MNAEEAFSRFVTGALNTQRAARFSGLVNSAKGRRVVLRALDHDLERAIRPDAKRGIIARTSPCYGFHPSVGFGAPFLTVAEAYSRLELLDGWLIVLTNGSGGIYRPESRWDAQIEIVI